MQILLGISFAFLLCGWVLIWVARDFARQVERDTRAGYWDRRSARVMIRAWWGVTWAAILTMVIMVIIMLWTV